MFKTSRLALGVLLSGAAIATGVGCGSSSDSASSGSASSGGAEYCAEVRDAFISSCRDKAVSETEPLLEAEGLPQEGVADLEKAVGALCPGQIACIEANVSEAGFGAQTDGAKEAQAMCAADSGAAATAVADGTDTTDSGAPAADQGADRLRVGA
ncbi:MAG: hypothetical protein FJW99_02225 [Actinobacteria bacterium]|nr:hypothetical protein [Actinomycetota bacterium]MBM3697015.1 hypothetical protein [Actinomycetota bacterium]